MFSDFSPSQNAARVSAGSLRPTTGNVAAEEVNLAIGEPGFATPAPIVKAFRDSDLFDQPGYGDFHGDARLRELIAAATSRALVKRSADEVLVTSGATSGITAAILAVVSPGDRVIIPNPAYSLYADAVLMAGGEPVFVPLTADHQLDLDLIEPLLAGARLIVICNPGNPTGVVLSSRSLEALGEMAQRSGTLVLADEAYADFDYEQRFVSTLDVASMQGILIYAQTFSKTYSMTGWRIGYLVAPSQIMAWVRQVHRGFVGSINRASQAAAIAALHHGPVLVAAQMTSFRQRRDQMMDALRSVPEAKFVEPDGAFYLLVRYPFDIDSVSMVRRLRSRGVVTRPGREFGPAGESHLRLAFSASSADIESGIQRLSVVFRELSAD